MSKISFVPGLLTKYWIQHWIRNHAKASDYVIENVTKVSKN